MYSFSLLLTYLVSWLPAGFQVWFLLLIGLMVVLIALKIMMFILDLKFW